MALASRVSYQGLTEMLLDFQERIPRKSQAVFGEWTRELGQMAHQLYRENLSGAVPSTAEDPLPVGIRTGELLDGAQLKIVNQFAFEEINETEWAGFIEDGTRFVAPRMPLQNAVDVMTIRMRASQDQVLVEIFEK